MARQLGSAKFIEVFDFHRDRSKPGRTLATARVGALYMSELIVDPGVVTGNYYHKKTKIMFFVTQGELQCTFVHIKTGEKKTINLKPCAKAIHVPPYVSFATKNISRDKAVAVYFTNLPLRSKDNFSFSVI